MNFALTIAWSSSFASLPSFESRGSSNWKHGPVTAPTARAIFTEQTCFPYITPHHLNTPIPGLTHDRPLRRTRDRFGRGVPGSQRLTGVLGRVEASARCQFLGDPRHKRNPTGLLAETGKFRGPRLPGPMGDCWMQGLLLSTATVRTRIRPPYGGPVALPPNPRPASKNQRCPGHL